MTGQPARGDISFSVRKRQPIMTTGEVPGKARVAANSPNFNDMLNFPQP